MRFVRYIPSTPASFFVGVLLGLTMVFPFLWPLSFFAVALGVVCIEESDSKNRALLRTSLFGLGVCGMSLSWMLLTYPTDWLGFHSPVGGALLVGTVWLGYVLPLSISLLPWGWFVYILRTKPFVIQMSFGTAAWVVGEYVRSWVATLVSWAPDALLGAHGSFALSGLSLSGSDGFLWAAYFGGFWSLAATLYVVSMFIVATYRCLQRSAARMGMIYATITGLVILAACFAPPALRTYLNISGVYINSTPIALVRTDFPHTESFSDFEVQDMARALAKSIVDAGIASGDGSIVLLPEDSRFFVSSKSLTEKEQMYVNQFIQTHHIILVDSGRSREWDGAFNIVQIEYPNVSASSTVYMRKALLAPFGEYMPSVFGVLWRALGFGEPLNVYLKSRAYAVAPEGFNPDKRVFTVNDTRFGVLSCSELVSPTLYTSLKKKADVIVVISSFAWGKGWPLLPNQLIAMAKIHAISARMPYMQATNAGPSVFIQPTLSHTQAHRSY